MSKSVFEYRKDNLLQLIERHETQEALQRATGIAASVLSRMKNWNAGTTNPSHKRIGEKLARQFEESLKLPIYWMDTPHPPEDITAVREATSRTSALAGLSRLSDVPSRLSADVSTLSPLQVATHDTMVKLMVAGKLPDTACLKLLQTWQSAIEELEGDA